MVDVNDLTTLAALKEYIGIDDASEDAFLDKGITRATRRIEGFTDRLLKLRAYEETYDGTGTPFLMLRQFPIVALTEVKIDALRQFGVSTAVDLLSVVVSKEEGKIGLAAAGVPISWSATFPLGTRIVKVKYTAGFASIPADLELAAIKVAAMDFARAREGGDGIISESISGRSVTWKDGVPEEVAEMLLPYRRSA